MTAKHSMSIMKPKGIYTEHLDNHYVVHYNISFPLDNFAEARVKEEFQIWDVFFTAGS